MYGSVFQTRIIGVGVPEVALLSVTRSSFIAPDVLDDPMASAAQLGVSAHRITNAQSIVPLVAVALFQGPREVELLERLDEAQWIGALSAVVPSNRRGYISYCCSTEIVPFELSPVSLVSLISVLKAHTGTTAGAVAGFYAGVGSPLVLITVPAGMILCGAAAALARTLEEGLELKLRKMMGLPPPSSGPPALQAQNQEQDP